MLMKYLLSIHIIGFFSLLSFGQNTFEIKQLGNHYTQEQITETFLSADFCGAYFISKRNIIQLNDGAIVELKSQSEMTGAGITIPSSCTIENNVIYHSATWSITPEGRLMKGLSPQLSPAEMKLNVIQH